MGEEKKSILMLHSKVVKYYKESQSGLFFFFFVILDQNVHFGNEIQKVMMSSKVLQFNVLQGLSLESHKTFK